MNKVLIFIFLFFNFNIHASDNIKLSLDWVPQAEHGGYFQAIAKGYYADQDIELTIIPGGPSVNTKAMLMSDQVEFNIGGSAGALNYAKQDLPFRAVAAFFQKTPQVLMSHPNVGIDHPSDFKGKTIFLSNFGRLSFWGFIKNKYNLSDDQLESYNFNSQPFIDDPQSIQQGYLSSEPFAIKKAAGFDLLSTYSRTTASVLMQIPLKLLISLLLRTQILLIDLSLLHAKDGRIFSPMILNLPLI